MTPLWLHGGVRICALSSVEILQRVGVKDGVWRSSLRRGDRLTIVTVNSVYKLTLMRNGSFMVSGGWFDRHHCNRTIVRVAGCTSGGSAINQELIAAPGMDLELGNRVVTTAIQQVIVEPIGWRSNLVHLSERNGPWAVVRLKRTSSK